MSSKCLICNSKKTALRCESCGDPSCKDCSFFIDEDSFELIQVLPESLQNKTFCSNCYNQHIGAQMDRYTQIMSQAKEVDVYSHKQSAETRLIKRVESPLKVRDYGDRETALMALAFMAAEKGFGTLVDVVIKSEKIGPGKSYKKLIWHGVGTPVDPSIKK